jgi:ribosomal protein S18 acetylase RimI-like enzyme
MMTIRPTLPEDIEPLLVIATVTRVFKAHEVETLECVLDDYFETQKEAGDQAHTAIIDHVVVGFVYFSEDVISDKSWELWWIIVDPQYQGQKIGAKLMEFAEDEMRKRGGRVCALDTSSTELYKPAQNFYLKIGYQHLGTIPDYYAEGDGKSIFWKKLSR